MLPTHIKVSSRTIGDVRTTAVSLAKITATCSTNKTA